MFASFKGSPIYFTFIQAYNINRIIKYICTQIAIYDRFHHEDDTLIHSWEYDIENEQFKLTIQTIWQENTACHCHPEYETRYNQTTHELPACDMLEFLGIYNEFDNMDICEYFEKFINTESGY